MKNNTFTTADLKQALRNGQYTFPGCYPCYFITSDGAALSFDAVRENFRQCLQSIKDNSDDGWRIVAVDVNYEDSSLYCDHTGKRIESAYAEDEVPA